MSLSKDYFKCLSITKNIKKDGNPYLFLKLQNSKEIIYGYLWNKLELYQSKIKVDCVYAIKYQNDIYNGLKVLNIKNINQVEGDRYKRYNYSSKAVLMTMTAKNNYFFNEISNFILNRNNVPMKILLEFLNKNKKIIISSKLTEQKYICLEYFYLLEKTLDKQIDSNLYIYIIIIDRLNLNVDSLISKVKKQSEPLYKSLFLYLNDNKGFIKKYKYIVDFIDDNLKNYINLKNEAKGRNEKK